MALSARWRSLAINLLVMSASLFVVLAALELAARVALRPNRGKERRERAAYTVFDPLVGWRLKPGARVRYDRDEYTTDVAINSLGMRDHERAPTPPPGETRLLLLGDSFVEGYTVQLDETIGQVLERKLRRADCPIEVLNGGVGGYSTDQEYLLYREAGRRLGARVVVLFVFHNDLAPLLTDNYYGTPKPRFIDDGRGGLTLTTNPLTPPAPRPAAAPRPRAKRPWRLRSMAWAWLQIRLTTGAPRLHEVLAGWGLWDPIDRVPVHPEFRVFHSRPAAETLEAWSIEDRLLADLKHDVEADGARFVVAYIPSKMEVDDADWEAACIQYDIDPKRWSREAVIRRLEESGRRGGFPVLDLTPALRAGNGSLHRAYLRLDRHWNSRGHRIAADAVADYLRATGLVPECARSPRAH
jgi:hypothetical protein